MTEGQPVGTVMPITADEQALRAKALQLARVNALIEGLREHPDATPIFDAWVRGEIDGDEARRRFDARLQHDLQHKAKR